MLAKIEGVNYTAIIGESAKIDVKQAVNYIKSGQAEISETVGDIIGEFNDNAVEKTNTFNQNAIDKTAEFDLNASNKTGDFNTNATNKTTNYNDNATSKTGAFDSNAVDKTNDFNLNASNKTTAFNENYTEKKALIDAEVSKSKTWAEGTDEEVTPLGGTHSAKGWAEIAEDAMSDVVKTSGNQKITGQKAFDTDNSLVVMNQSLVKGTNPSTKEYMNISFMAKDGVNYRNRYGVIESNVDTNGDVKTLLGAYKNLNPSSEQQIAELSVVYPSTGDPYTEAPTPTEDTTTSKQIDTVGARNTKLGNYVELSGNNTFTGDNTFKKEIDGYLASYSAYNAGSTSDTYLNPYKKLCDCVLTGANISRVIPFVYSRTQSTDINGGTYLGRISLRTTSTAGDTAVSSTGVVLTNTPDYINNRNIIFYVLYKNNTPSSDSVTFEVWVYVKGTYTGVSVIPLKIGTGGTNYNTSGVTWYNNTVKAAELPSGYEVINQNLVSNYIDTPAASDDSKKAANTEFVHDAIALDAVTLSGNQSIDGVKTFTSAVTYKGSAGLTYNSIHSSAVKGTTPTSNVNSTFSFLDSTFSGSYNATISRTQYGYDTSGNTFAKLQAFKPTSASTQTGTIAVYYPSTGDPYTEAPTPATSDNSTKIATTGYVKAQDYATNSTLCSSPYLVLYGTSTSEAADTAKIVEISSSYATTPTISAGQLLIVKPTITSTVADSTITVQKSSTTLLEAKTMRYNNANITTSTDSIVWTANVPSIFVYDGSYWQFLGHGLDNNTTYSTMSVSEGTTGTATNNRVMRADYLKQIIEGRLTTGISGYDATKTQTLKNVNGTLTWVND